MTQTVSPDTTEDHEHDHPSDRTYVGIAIVLAIITAAEVLTYFVDIGDALIPALMIMMVAKFFLVAAFFMHLKFDIPMFTRLFVGGIALATIVYVVMLTAFQFWDTFDF